jgi:hypothetical protein
MSVGISEMEDAFARAAPWRFEVATGVSLCPTDKAVEGVKLLGHGDVGLGEQSVESTMDIDGQTTMRQATACRAYAAHIHPLSLKTLDSLQSMHQGLVPTPRADFSRSVDQVFLLDETDILASDKGIVGSIGSSQARHRAWQQEHGVGLGIECREKA